MQPLFRLRDDGPAAIPFGLDDVRDDHLYQFHDYGDIAGVRVTPHRVIDETLIPRRVSERL
jgi:hypothetical protein